MAINHYTHLKSVKLSDDRLENYSPVEHLAKALWLSKWRNNYMQFLTGYFDETGQAEDIHQSVNGMAGCIAPVHRWIEIENAWNEHINTRGVQYKDYHDRLIRPRDRERRRKPLLDILEKYPVLPMAWLVSTEAIRLSPPLAQTVLGDPYYRAFIYCMNFTCFFVSSDQTSETEKVITIFDRKNRHFRNKLVEYYDLWRESDSRTDRMFEEPAFRRADFPPMYVADMVAAILKEEFERQLHNPTEDSTDSFKRIHQIAMRVLTQSPGECWVDECIPFRFLATDGLIELVQPMLDEVLEAFEKEKGYNPLKKIAE